MAPSFASPLALPERMSDVLASLDVAPTDVTVDPYTAATGDISRVFTRRYVVDVAITEYGRQEITAEVAGRRWACERGVAVATTTEYRADDAVLVTKRLTGSRPPGSEFVDSAIAVADRIATGDTPPLDMHVVRSWRTDRRGRAMRILRLVRGGLPVQEFRQARARAMGLPATMVAHGDFHPGNLLFDPDRQELVVIDWATMGHAPRFSDLVRLWCQSRHADDRARIAEHLLQQASGDGREPLAALWHWFALRQLAEYYSDPAGRPDDEGYEEFLWERLGEARALARELERTSA